MVSVDFKHHAYTYFMVVRSLVGKEARLRAQLAQRGTLCSNKDTNVFSATKPGHKKSPTQEICFYFARASVCVYSHKHENTR